MNSQCFSVVLLFVLSLILSENYVESQFIDLDAYYKMPKLHSFDDHSVCKRGNQGYVYCVVRSVLTPNSSSDLWNQIKEFSKPPIHYEHTLLDRGVCIENCKKIIQHLDKKTQAALFQPKFDINYTYILDEKYFESSKTLKNKYGRLINVCLNYQLQEEFNLRAYSEIEYCESSEDPPAAMTTPKILFLVLLAVLFVLLTASTIYDQSIEKCSEGSSDAILTAFSIPRNIRKLNVEPTSEIQRDFKFFEGLRTASIIGIMILHSYMGTTVIPQTNPEMLEDRLSDPVGQYFLAIVPTLVHTFFTISGMLMAVHFLDHTDKHPEFKLSYFWDKLTNRINRLVPVYAFVIFFLVSWMEAFSLSINSKRFIDVEIKQCQKNWWVNLLFINNYINMDEPCMQHSWYLGADMHMFVIGTSIMMIIWKYPRTMKLMTILMALFSFIAPAYVVYSNGFEPILVSSLKLIRFFLWFDNGWFNKFYNTTHTNTGGYFYGMIAGIIYNKVKKNEFSLKDSKVFNMVQTWVVPFFFVMLGPTYLFYKGAISYPSILTAIYASLTKNTWGVMCSVLFLGCVFGKKTTFHKILDHGIFTPMGKVTYCVYLIHMTVLKFVVINMSGAVEINDLLLVTIISAEIFLSYVLGYMLCICIELPMSTVLKEMFDKKKNSIKKE